jgi:hypothetical protein
VGFAAITLCVVSQQVFIVVVVYFVIDSVRKLVNTSSYLVYENVYVCININLLGPFYMFLVFLHVWSTNFNIIMYFIIAAGRSQ